MQEMFTDVKAALVVGPDIGKTAPVASYWFYHLAIYREAKIVVISQDDYPLGWRAELWLKPNPGTTGMLLNGIAREIVDQGLAADVASGQPDSPSGSASLDRLRSRARRRGDRRSRRADHGGRDPLRHRRRRNCRSDRTTAIPPSLIYQTVAHHGRRQRAAMATRARSRPPATISPS